MSDRSAANRSFYNQNASFYYATANRSNGNYRYGASANRSQNTRTFHNRRDHGPNRARAAATAETSDLTQRERLADQIARDALECLICYEPVRSHDRIWNCFQCYHTLHLHCIRKWAEKSTEESDEWRCPACQFSHKQKTIDYFCYCGKVRNPAQSFRLLAHSCGSKCDRGKPDCDHRCKLTCHPGACSECNEPVQKYCGCGAIMFSTVCNKDASGFLCDNVCRRVLNCGRHLCERKCHAGACDECAETYSKACECGQTTKTVTCAEQNTAFVCGRVCGMRLECGYHSCEQLCHAGRCLPCPLLPRIAVNCPCAKTEINSTRTNCLEPLMCCSNKCDKTLKCGHKCTKNCHSGECSSCSLKATVKCVCGRTKKTVACTELLTSDHFEFVCEKKCKKMRICGKHRCNKECCTYDYHVCELRCNRVLSCNKHRCDRLCHSDSCKPCPITSFEELPCTCGKTIIYPPIRCGTRKPVCSQVCNRMHACNHPVSHNCHAGKSCPPCRAFTLKLCYGRHEMRDRIPCCDKSFSCGAMCNKALDCGRHKCTRPCHKAPCLANNAACNHLCSERRICGHLCNLKCHAPPCKRTPCKESVTVTCMCGLLKEERPCADFVREYERNAQENAEKEDAPKSGGSDRVRINLAILECTEECKKFYRNLKLAIALHIENPDLTGKIVPKYTDSMKKWAEDEPEFVQMVHDKLTELVKLSKVSKQKFRSFPFNAMNKRKRQFIHDYCEFFRCESVAYDKEPNRNVVATAFKDKCWLPSMSVIEVVRRDKGMARVIVPQQLLAAEKDIDIRLSAMKLCPPN